MLILPIRKHEFFQSSIYFSYFPQCSKFSLSRFCNSLVRFFFFFVFLAWGKSKRSNDSISQFLPQNVGYWNSNSIPHPPFSILHLWLFYLVSTVNSAGYLCPIDVQVYPVTWPLWLVEWQRYFYRHLAAFFWMYIQNCITGSKYSSRLRFYRNLHAHLYVVFYSIL